MRDLIPDMLATALMFLLCYVFFSLASMGDALRAAASMQ